MELVVIAEGEGLVDEAAEASVGHVLLQHPRYFEMAVGAGVEAGLEWDVRA